MIKMHQINSLSNFSLFNGINAGFVLNFRDESVEDNNETYFLPIQNFNNFLVESGKKSINKKDVVTYGGILVEQNKKRTHYSYNINKMFSDLNKERGH